MGSVGDGRLGQGVSRVFEISTKGGPSLSAHGSV